MMATIGQNMQNMQMYDVSKPELPPLSHNEQRQQLSSAGPTHRPSTAWRAGTMHPAVHSLARRVRCSSALPPPVIAHSYCDTHRPFHCQYGRSREWSSQSLHLAVTLGKQHTRLWADLQWHNAEDFLWFPISNTRTCGDTRPALCALRNILRVLVGIQDHRCSRSVIY
jgi:hypothetical protein